MNLFDWVFIKLFTKAPQKLLSDNGVFEFDVPIGFRYRCAMEFFQLLKPDSKGFLFQWSTHVLPVSEENEFNADKELDTEREHIPSCVIRTIGNYDCICSATISEDKREIIYTWKFGENNKRVLVTLLLDGTQQREQINDWIAQAESLIPRFKIHHI